MKGLCVMYAIFIFGCKRYACGGGCEEYYPKDHHSWTVLNDDIEVPLEIEQGPEPRPQSWQEFYTQARFDEERWAQFKWTTSTKKP